MEPTAAALRQALVLAHSAAADGPYGPREQVHPAAAAGHVKQRRTRGEHGDQCFFTCPCAWAEAAPARVVAAAGLVCCM